MWFTEYIEEIETDFLAIYGIKDMWSLDGPYFVRFAARLIYYTGAVQGKLKADYSETQEDGSIRLRTDTSSGPTKKVSLSEAMSKYQRDDLDAINYESESAMGGTLFERVSVPAN